MAYTGRWELILPASQNLVPDSEEGATLRGDQGRGRSVSHVSSEDQRQKSSVNQGEGGNSKEWIHFLQEPPLLSAPFLPFVVKCLMVKCISGIHLCQWD